MVGGTNIFLVLIKHLQKSSFSGIIFKAQSWLCCISMIFLGTGVMEFVELNERCRFLCYTPGQHFKAHIDSTYIRRAANGDVVDIKGKMGKRFVK